MIVRLIVYFKYLYLIAITATSSTILCSAELPVILKYPTQSDKIILTAVEGNNLIFRPMGSDDGGRIIIKIEELISQGAQLNFLFPDDFYDAVEQLESGEGGRSISIISKYVDPLVSFLSLSNIPGNMLPSIIVYLEALKGVEDWERVVDLATHIPLSIAPPWVMDNVGELALSLHDRDKSKDFDRLYFHILDQRSLALAHLQSLMHLAEHLRIRADYLRAFYLYRKIQVGDGSLQVLAKLWVAYCSFYLGHDIVPEIFLEVLPEIDVSEQGYALRELIKARLSIRDENFYSAMRFAAKGRIHAKATDVYYPELLYVVASLYNELGYAKASNLTQNELRLLFPESRWSKKNLNTLRE